MLNDYIKDQPIAYKIMKNAIEKNRCSHAYLIEANEYTRKNDMVLAFAKYLLCKNHHLSKEQSMNCPICNKEPENLLDLKIVKADGLWIKKNQMEDLQIDFGKKAIECDNKVYIIEEADKLNSSSANSILKFLEEPEEGIVALLIVDNLYQVLPTILSRCQIIPLKKSLFMNPKNTIDQLQKMNLVSPIDEELLKEKIEKIIHFAIFLEQNGQATLLFENNLWFATFQTKEDMMWALNILLYFYKDILSKKCERFLEIFIDYEAEIHKISEKNSMESLCDKINIIIDAKESLKMNLNLNLVLDHLINSIKDVK